MNKASNVINDPSLVKTLNIRECEDFLQDDLVYCKRSNGLKEIKEDVRQRIVVLNRQSYVEANAQKLLDTLECSHNRVKHLWKDLKDHDRKDFHIPRHARSVSNDIHDLPRIPVGLISKSAMAGDGEITYEHFHSRQNAGSVIIRTALACKDKYSFNQHVKMLYEFSQVVITTKKENGELMKFQKTGIFKSPKASYEEANIKLIRTNEFVAPEVWAQLFKILGLPEMEPYDFDI